MFIGRVLNSLSSFASSIFTRTFKLLISQLNCHSRSSCTSMMNHRNEESWIFVTNLRAHHSTCVIRFVLELIKTTICVLNWLLLLMTMWMRWWLSTSTSKEREDERKLKMKINVNCGLHQVWRKMKILSMSSTSSSFNYKWKLSWKYIQLIKFNFKYIFSFPFQLKIINIPFVWSSMWCDSDSKLDWGYSSTTCSFSLVSWWINHVIKKFPRDTNNK